MQLMQIYSTPKHTVHNAHAISREGGTLLFGVPGTPIGASNSQLHILGAHIFYAKMDDL